MNASLLELVAVDVGNSRLKMGRFAVDRSVLAAGSIPQPSQLFEVPAQEFGLEQIAHWLAPQAITEIDWYLASVNRPAATRLIDWLRGAGVERMTMLCAADLPLVVELPHPDRVGIDRLLAAVSAARLRRPGRPAIVVDLGSAITVDLLSAEGAFQGGAILPGIAMAARGMYEFTDLLPLLDMHQLDEPPAPLGRTTEEAMRAGLFWGAVGGVRELIHRFEADAQGEANVFLSGGAAPSVAQLLKAEARYEPHLVLAGIALTAARLQTAEPH